MEQQAGMIATKMAEQPPSDYLQQQFLERPTSLSGFGRCCLGFRCPDFAARDFNDEHAFDVKRQKRCRKRFAN